MLDSPVSLPASSRVGEYEILGLVGNGGFGFVYKARDLTLNRIVAIKEYFPATIATRSPDGTVGARLAAHKEIYQRGLRSFLHEARVLAQFDDPVLVKIHRFWEQNATAYMVMPFYEGVTLRVLRHRQPSLMRDTWLFAFLASILTALEKLHGIGIYHRDLSPENILILESGGLVLLDFGSARQALVGVGGNNEVMLKPGYAPVEQYMAEGGLSQGAWTDLYGLGAVLYFLLEGEAPPPAINRWREDGYKALAERSAHRERDAALLKVIDACLSVRPEARPQNVKAVRDLIGLDGARPHFNLFATLATGESAPSSAPESDLTIPIDPITILSEVVKTGGEASLPPLPSTLAIPVAPAPSKPMPATGDSTVAEPAAAPAAKPAAVEEKAQTQPRKGNSHIKAGLLALFSACLLIAGTAAWMHQTTSAKQPPAQMEVAPAVAVQQTPQSKIRGMQAEMPTPDSGTQQASAATPSSDNPPALQLLPGASPALQPGSTIDNGKETAKPLDPAATPVEKPIAPTMVRFDIRPWGTIVVDGKDKGPSPPLKKLKLAAGKHHVEISNPGFPSYSADIEVTAGEDFSVKHNFEQAHE